MGKIKSLTLVSKCEDGSLRMPHPESLIKSQRIVRYLGVTEIPWKVFLSHYLNNVRATFLLQSNVN